MEQRERIKSGGQEMKIKKSLTVIFVLVVAVLFAALLLWRGDAPQKILYRVLSAELAGHDHAEVAGHQHEEHGEHMLSHGGQEQAHADVDDHGHDGQGNHEEHAEGHDHEEQGEHEEYGEREGQHGHEHAEHGSPTCVQFSKEEMDEFGLVIETAGPGVWSIVKQFPGEIRINDELHAHVLPMVPGVVREVRKTFGEHVSAGEVMAVIESRELADAKATYLAALESVGLAQAKFAREEKLWTKKITSEEEYLDAKLALAQARIQLRSAEQSLHAIGFSEQDLRSLPDHPHETLTRYEIIAPIDGVVVEKHCALGEKVEEDTNIFTVADLSTVWVDLSVYQKDLVYVKEGQEVTISADFDIPEARGTISYISPIILKETRAALARVVLPNPDGRWRPGLFVTAELSIGGEEVPLLIPKTALQTIDNESVVFVETDRGFEIRPVTVGRSNEGHLEILDGLYPGQRYVAQGTFECKAKIVTTGMDPHAGHGH
jgi:cobalt-zinc-cadmium efflux system membrane fusion protein